MTLIVCSWILTALSLISSSITGYAVFKYGCCSGVWDCKQNTSTDDLENPSGSSSEGNDGAKNKIVYCNITLAENFEEFMKNDSSSNDDLPSWGVIVMYYSLLW